MMIFKSLCLQKPLLKSQKCMTCYAGRGLRSGVAVRGFVSGRGPPRSGGKDSPNGAYRSECPCRPAMFGWWYFRDWPRQYDIDLNQKGEWYCGKLRCHSTDRTALTRHVNTEKLSCLARRDKVFWFSTLLTTAVPYYILTIRKLADSMNVKRQVRKGVLAWAFGRSIHIIYWYTISCNKKNKTNKCQEGRKLFTSSKI